MKVVRSESYLIVTVLLLGSLFFACSSPISSQAEGNRTLALFEQPLGKWDEMISNHVKQKYSLAEYSHTEGEQSLRIDYTFKERNKPFVAFLIKKIGNENWERYKGISLWTYIPTPAEDLGHFSIMLYEKDGSAYISQFVRPMKESGWKKVSVPFSTFVYSSGGGFFKNKKEPLNLRKIKKISFGIYQSSAFADKNFTIYISDLQLTPSAQEESSSDIREHRQPFKIHDSQKTDTPAQIKIIDDFSNELTGWTKNSSPTIDLNFSIDSQMPHSGNKSLKLRYDLLKDQPFIGFVEKNLGLVQDWRDFDAIKLWTSLPKPADDLVALSIMLYEKDGSAYIAQHTRSLKTSGWEETAVSFSKFFLAGDWTFDENGQLDLDQIQKISIGIFQPTKFKDRNLTVYLNNIQVQKNSSPATVTSVANDLTVVSSRQKFEPPDGHVYNGAFAFEAPMQGWGSKRSDWEGQFDKSQLSEYEKLSGRRVELVGFIWFLDWDFPMTISQRIVESGRIPVVGITSSIKLDEIVAGKHDGRIKQWAQDARQLGKPIFSRFLAEMNGNWNSYSEAFDPSQTHDKYIEAWRHVVRLFKEAGANNVSWVWAPTAVDVGNVHWTEYYPGDEFVDWVGISVYSFLGNGDPEEQIMGIYNDYAARKPIMIAECGAGDADNNPGKYSPGNSYRDNPVKWINRFFDTLETKAKRVKAFMWFNIDRERVWKIQESSEKINTYRKRLEKGRYGAKLEE